MIPLALICAALIGLIVYLLHHFAVLERAWACERELLISRIQHPEIVPPLTHMGAAKDIAEQMTKEVQAPESDEYDLVGTIEP